MLATAISVTLSGCASVEYQKVSDNASKAQTVPMPKVASETAYAAPMMGPFLPATAGAKALQNASGPATQTAALAGTSLDQKATQAAAQTASPVGTAGQAMVGQQVASVANTNPLTASDAATGAELAYAPPALVAIPTPRPDIIAAANSLPTPADAEQAQTAALQTGEPLSSAAKDVENLDQRLASADPMPGNPNPLLGTDVAVPTPRPGSESMGLEAYANQPALMARDAMDTMDGFDTSAPKEIGKPTLAPSGKLQALIKKYADLYGVPEALVHRVVKRESTYNPSAYHSGNYGLMQIRYNTAKSLGYTGSPSGLFDAETNLKYAVKYLRGAFMVAENNHDNAVRLYARGYYYDAKRKGMLAQVQ
jgi:soluble lytic murein transglycosylase-like protein